MSGEMIVEVVRGVRVESVHSVAVAVVDAEGASVFAAGDTARPVFPRSAIKPLQALPLIETGAADALSVTPAELALACASHNGEPKHAGAVRAWLGRMGLGVDRLACGGHPPYDGPSNEALLRAGAPFDRACDNCSGKHAGMLATASHAGEPVAGYADPGHPAQRRIAAALADMAGRGALDAPAIDGCDAPNWPLPLAALASAFARFGAPDGLPAARAAACRRVASAMAARPDLVAGRGRLCTALMTAAPHLVAKVGAEGVYAAAWPARGLGVALKVADGATRAAETALLALLARLGALDGDALAALDRWAAPVLRSRAGRMVGVIRPGDGWPERV